MSASTIDVSNGSIPAAAHGKVKTARLPYIGVWGIRIGAGLALLAGPLYRNHYLPTAGSALLLLVAGTAVLLIATLLIFIGIALARRRGTPLHEPVLRMMLPVAFALFVIGSVVAAVARGAGAPSIHEVSTDLANPPEFVTVKKIREQLRATTPDLNPSEYVPVMNLFGTEIDVKAEQAKAWPEIKPLELAIPPTEAFERAKTVINDLDWRLVDVDATTGRIEAYAVSSYFQFKDDVVVRVTALGSGSRVDIRSKSRVGGGDLGANAARVKEFLKRMAS